MTRTVQDQRQMAKKSRTTAFFKIVCPLLLVVLAVGFATVGFRLHHLPQGDGAME